jgi:CHAT domain-containing protein
VGKPGTIQYFAEWRPIHEVVSATVYAEVRKERKERRPSPVLLAAFGDPRYPSLSKDQAEHVENPAVRAFVSRGASLAPLPSSREEVESIAGLFPGKANVYLGAEATEERAKALRKDVPYVHFAVHARLDERFPLDSALVLSIPEKVTEGRDNGLLQAWEILEQVRIDADLVTLSACETGLGKEVRGEGLIGLTRAFQYAGARSVLASLWKVSDRSTARLMKSYYAYLRAGRSKDEALRAAETDAIRALEASQKGFAHPFYWAAFQLFGDWE